jgi:hypothetical protein
VSSFTELRDKAEQEISAHLQSASPDSTQHFVVDSTDEIVKIVLGCRSADHLVTVWLLASRGSSTAGDLRRSAGAVKMQRPTGRTILTAPSTGTSSKPEEPRPCTDDIIKPVLGCRSALWPASARRTSGRPARPARRNLIIRCIINKPEVRWPPNSATTPSRTSQRARYDEVIT